MRAFILIGLFGFIVTQAWAECTSTMEVHTDLHRPIKVYVDGHTGDNPPTVGVVVNNISPGVHHLQVVEVRINRFGQNVRRIVYSGNVDIRPSMYIDARVDEGQGINLHNTPVECGQQYSPPADNGQQPQTPATNNAAAPVQSSPAPVAAIPTHMSDADFRKIVTAVTSTKYETKKLDTLRIITNNAQVATDQVRQLMNLFSFESNKLDVAKMLYDHTVDKQNYSKLTASFNFDANKEAFKKFVSAQ
ncbi:MAG: hypothetical protein JWO03_648 [Bacteroidetes bacterium]|nr:hypothetical protein [Bacteroidota bacterium]